MNTSSSYNTIKQPAEYLDGGTLNAPKNQNNLLQTLYADSKGFTKAKEVSNRNVAIVTSVQQPANTTEEVKESSFRRGPPKAHHHKLPSAFSFNYSKKPSGKSNNFGMMMMTIPKAPEENSTQKIESMVDISEYKQIQNLLSPIKMVDLHKMYNQNQDSLFLKEGKVVRSKLTKLLSYHELNGQTSFNDLSFGQTLNQTYQQSSPFQINLASHTKMLDHSKKKEGTDLLIEKVNSFTKKNENTKQFSEKVASELQKQNQNCQPIKEGKSVSISSHFKVKLEEMITLSMLKNNKSSGAIKKMLHAPTLSLFAVKEQPISSKFVRKSLRDWLHFWPSYLNSNDQFVKVYGTWWNVPEGCVSIAMEHVQGGSLQDLLEGIGNLNESAIKTIAQQILEILCCLHEKHQICHSGLSPSQILITKEGLIKISLGISSRSSSWSNYTNVINHSNNSNNNVFSSLITIKKNNDNSNTKNTWAKNVMERQDEQSIRQADLGEKQEEVFKFGLILLLSALGNLDFLEDSDNLILNQISKKAEEAKNSDETLNYCCLLHDQDLQPRCFGLPLSELLSSYSNHFQDFLCKCLQIHPKKRQTIQELLNHPFISSSEQSIHNFLPSLPELIGMLNKISKQQNPLPEQFQAASEKQLSRVCQGISMILPHCQQWFKMWQYQEFLSHLPNLQPTNYCIQDLSLDLGMEPCKVHQRIVSTFEEVPLFKEFKRKFIFNPSSNTTINSNNNNNNNNNI